MNNTIDTQFKQKMITARTEMCGLMIRLVKMATQHGVDVENLLREGNLREGDMVISLTQYLGPGDVPARPALIVYSDAPDGETWQIMNTYEDSELNRSFRATCAELLPGLGL